MRMLFVWSAATVSTYDVARGYRHAFARQGHVLRDYKLFARIEYHARAIAEKTEQIAVLSELASENIVVEAMKHRADLVFIVSGMTCHPNAIWLLRRAGIPATVLFTESPYNDPQQREWVAVYPEMTVFTNERLSARREGWYYLPHAYDPEIHRPVDAGDLPRCDVLFVGTLWPERVAFFEAIDWTGITLQMHGTWPDVQHDDTAKRHVLELAATAAASPIRRYFSPGCVRNEEIAGYYAAATMVVNVHRTDPDAESLNPRCYEVPACGTLLVTDGRRELGQVFRPGSVATFTDAASLHETMRYYLDHAEARADAIAQAQVDIRPHTFDRRAQQVMEVLAPALPVAV